MGIINTNLQLNLKNMAQVLCIETASTPTSYHMSLVPQKGEIYNAYKTESVGQKYKNIDMWHRLEEMLPKEAAHVSIFIDLPKEEGQSFKKEETVEIPQKLQPYYS